MKIGPQISEKCEMDGFQQQNPLFPPHSMQSHETKYTALFHMTYLTYLPATASQKAKNPNQNLENDGNFPKRQAETPKWMRQPFGLEMGHFRPWWRGATNGNPLKVNIW
jgi:hypothetical protein